MVVLALRANGGVIPDFYTTTYSGAHAKRRLDHRRLLPTGRLRRRLRGPLHSRLTPLAQGLSLRAMNDEFRRPRRNEGLSVGKDIEAWCGRCKRQSGHTITAMVSGEVAQVRCTSCGGTHKYRATAAPKRGKGSKRAKGVSDEARYQRLMADRDPDEAIAYSNFARPPEGALLKHKKHGLGIVLSVGPDKAVVLFAGGKRNLIVPR